MIGDRRKYVRHKDLVATRISLGGRAQRLVTTDLSPTGAFFAASESPAVGEVIEVSLRPAGVKPSPVHLRAEVVRAVSGGGAHQPGFAVRWLTAHSEVGGEVLFQFLRQVLRLPGVARESMGNERTITYEFPPVGGEFPIDRRIPSGGPPLITRDRAAQPPSSQGGRLGRSRVVSEAIGGRSRPDSMAARPPGSSPAAALAQQGQPEQVRSTGRGIGVPPQAPAPAPKSAPAPASQAGARPVQSGGWATAGGTGTDSGRRTGRLPSTARRNSGAVQSDNVMVGAPIRRQSQSTDVNAHRRRVSERARARASSSTSRGGGRFTGVPAGESVRPERLLPDIEPGGRRPTRPPASARKSGRDSPFQERSLIFGGGGSISTIGQRPISDVAPPEGDEGEQGIVAVDVPVTYELDSRFVVGRIVAAAPLAVEIETSEQAPQLEQQVTVNMPVEVEQEWATVYLMGKLLRVPEERGDERIFVLHIERVVEGKYEGAYGRFLAATHGA